MDMPAQGEVTYTLGSQAATASVSYDAGPDVLPSQSARKLLMPMA